MEKLKMYILVKDNLPHGFKALASAHASISCYKAFENNPDMIKWINGTFFKVICSVNDKEFNRAKTFEDCIILTESALDNQEVAIAFRPRKEWPKPFKFYRMYKD